MIGAIVKELIGLFVDDELLAAIILCVVVVIGASALSGVAPGWLVGLMLALALPAALAASVLRSAQRATRKAYAAHGRGKNREAPLVRLDAGGADHRGVDGRLCAQEPVKARAAFIGQAKASGSA